MTKRIAGIRFNSDDYIEINMDDKSLIEVTSDGTTEYSIGGSAKKLLYTNPNTTAEMSTGTMFNESELEGYAYIEFVVTNTSGEYEVKELCEIAPLKAHSGQFVISYPVSGGLYARKIYRSNGAVKPSANVYDFGKTTEDRTQCIVKEAYAVK